MMEWHLQNAERKQKLVDFDGNGGRWQWRKTLNSPPPDTHQIYLFRDQLLLNILKAEWTTCAWQRMPKNGDRARKGTPLTVTLQTVLGRESTEGLWADSSALHTENSLRLTEQLEYKRSSPGAPPNSKRAAVLSLGHRVPLASTTVYVPPPPW